MAGFSYSGAYSFKPSARFMSIVLKLLILTNVVFRKLSLTEICFKFLTVLNISWKIWSDFLSQIMFLQRLSDYYKIFQPLIILANSCINSDIIPNWYLIIGGCAICKSAYIRSCGNSVQVNNLQCSLWFFINLWSRTHNIPFFAVKT